MQAFITFLGEVVKYGIFLTVALAIVLFVLNGRRDRRALSLSSETLTVFTIHSKNHLKEISVTYDGKTVDQLYTHIFRLQNIGRKDCKLADIVAPLKVINEDGDLLDYRCVASSDVKPTLTLDGDNIELRFELLKKNEFIDLQILSQSSTVPKKDNIRAVDFDLAEKPSETPRSLVMIQDFLKWGFVALVSCFLIWVLVSSIGKRDLKLESDVHMTVSPQEEKEILKNMDAIRDARSLVESFAVSNKFLIPDFNSSRVSDWWSSKIKIRTWSSGAEIFLPNILRLKENGISVSIPKDFIGRKIDELDSSEVLFEITSEEKHHFPFRKMLWDGRFAN